MWLALVAASLTVWPVGDALAQARDEARAVVVATELDAPIARRLRAELTAQGFEAVPCRASPGTQTVEELTSVERASDAVAALRVDLAARVIEVWLSEAPGAPPTMIEAVHWADGGFDDEALAAVQAAEALHAARLRIEAIRPALPPLPPLPPPDQTQPPTLPSPPHLPPVPPPSPSPREPSPASARPFALTVGSSVIASPGGIPPAAALSLSASWHPQRSWTLGLLGHLPLLPATVTHSPQGTAEAWPTLLAAQVAHTLGRETRLLQPDAGLGLGVALLHLDGHASAPLRSGNADLWMTAGLARGGVSMRIAGPLRLRADATLGVGLPGGKVLFAQAGGGTVQVATWGLPLFVGTGGLELGLP